MLKEFDKWLAGAETLRTFATQADTLDQRNQKLVDDLSQMDLEKAAALQKCNELNQQLNASKRDNEVIRKADQEKAQRIAAYQDGEKKLLAEKASFEKQVKDLTTKLESYANTEEAKAARERERQEALTAAKKALADNQAAAASRQAEIARLEAAAPK